MSIVKGQEVIGSDRWETYNMGHTMLAHAIEAYRLSISNGQPRPKNWKPSDTHLKAMDAVVEALMDWQ